MQRLVTCWVILFFSGCSILYSAPSNPPAGTSSNATQEKTAIQVENLRVNVTGHYLTLEFELPYPGLVDFQLKKENGETIWRNYYVKEEGENRIRVKVRSLPGGERYGFSLDYKGKNLYQDFELPLTQ